MVIFLAVKTLPMTSSGNPDDGKLAIMAVSARPRPGMVRVIRVDDGWEGKRPVKRARPVAPTADWGDRARRGAASWMMM